MVAKDSARTSDRLDLQIECWLPGLDTLDKGSFSWADCYRLPFIYGLAIFFFYIQPLKFITFWDVHIKAETGETLASEYDRNSNFSYKCFWLKKNHGQPQVTWG